MPRDNCQGFASNRVLTLDGLHPAEILTHMNTARRVRAKGATIMDDPQNKPPAGEAREGIIKAIGDLRVLATKVERAAIDIRVLEQEWLRALDVPVMVAADITSPLTERYIAILAKLQAL